MVRFLSFTCVIVFSLAGFAGTPPPFDYSHAHFETGQILAISEPMADAGTFVFELVTGSRYGHVGIVSVEGAGVFVYNSDPPFTQKYRVEVFLAKAIKPSASEADAVNAAVKALFANGITPEARVSQAQILLAKYPLMITQLNPKKSLSIDEKREMKTFMDGLVAAKIPYNRSQYRNSHSLNCSEFVYKVYRHMGRDGIGKVQLFRDLNMDSLGGRLISWWKSIGGEVRLDGEIVSPASVVLSDGVDVISANLPFDHLISDHEVLQDWSDFGGVTTIEKYLGVPADQAATFLSESSTEPYAERVVSSQSEPRCKGLF